MLEIIHDIAPNATLFFHTAGNSPSDFAVAVQRLVDAGCNIICDDITFLDEPFFEDGLLTQEINNLSSNILFFSSAGNSGNTHYQGFFYP